MRCRSLFGAILAPLLITACTGPVPEAPADDAGSVTAIAADGPLYLDPPSTPTPVPRRGGMAVDPIVIPECRLTVIDRQDVPSQRDGVILAIGTEIGPDAPTPAGAALTIGEGKAVRRFRPLAEDDVVEAGQVLAQLDDRLARDDWSVKNSRVAAGEADRAASEKTRDEARSRYETQLRLRSQSNGSASLEELRAAKLTWDRYFFEARSKQEAVRLAEWERSQAQTVLSQHQLRSAIPGILKSIGKKRGEAVKAMETVFQIHDLSSLRAEGCVDLEHWRRVRKGMMAVVEPTHPEGPVQTFLGHLDEVTAVAVSNAADPLIVSAGEDRTVRVWDRTSRFERGVLRHPAAVRAVACTPPGAATHWCLSGAADGVARLWDLNRLDDAPLRLLSGHRGPIISVAFSPDGKSCATGGEDREVRLWDVSSGALLYCLPEGHRAAVTSVQFTPGSRLVTAGRDDTLRLWDLTQRQARLAALVERRSGEVAVPGVSPDGRRVLLDQGKVLRILALPESRTEGILENPGDSQTFTTFALFSPDARLILTAGAAEGQLQLWRAPTVSSRPHEIRQLVARERSPATAAAFAPNGSFLVTGTRDRQVLVWALPRREEVTHLIHAKVTLVEQAVESSSRQVKVWADFANPLDPSCRLLPGTTASLAIYPDQP